MAILNAAFDSETHARAAADTLRTFGVPDAAIRIGPSPTDDPALGPCTLTIDVHRSPVAIDVLGAVMHKHQASRVYGNPSDLQPPVPVPPENAPSTGTYQMHVPLGGGEHAIDPVGGLLPPAAAVPPRDPGNPLSSQESPQPPDSDVLLDATRPLDQNL